MTKRVEGRIDFEKEASDVYNKQHQCGSYQITQKKISEDWANSIAARVEEDASCPPRPDPAMPRLSSNV